MLLMMYMGGTEHTLSNCLLACCIGAWLGTFGVEALLSCTSPSYNTAFFSILYCEAGQAPSLRTMGPCSASCLDGPEQLGCYGG